MCSDGASTCWERTSPTKLSENLSLACNGCGLTSQPYLGECSPNLLEDRLGAVDMVPKVVGIKTDW